MQTQSTVRDETKFFLDLQNFALQLKKRENIVVIFHHDADGVSSGAIAIKALTRLGKKVNHLCLKQLYKENISQIKELGSTFLFVDFGSGQLDYLKSDLGEDSVFILDHHIPLKENDKEIKMKWHINPLLYGIDGGNELSGAGTTFYFALALDKNNSDLSTLAIIGALGDMMDYTGSLKGLNRKIIGIAESEKLLTKKIDLRLYGRISRPLVSYLSFASSPILPNLTASQDNCINFLNGLDIKLKDSHGNYKSYEDLVEVEKRKLSTALIMHLNNFGIDEWKIKELIGEVYTLEKENKKSPLRDAKEFATLLNACGRNKKTDIALAVCLGDRDPFGEYGKALAMLQIHRENLRAGIEFVQKNGIKEEKNFYLFDAKNEIDESIVGIIAGMLYGSVINETKPIIALAQNNDGTIKISGRATSTLVRKGINLGGAFKEISKLVEGVEGGGHFIAAGCKIPLEKKDEVLKLLNNILEKQIK